MSRDQRSSSSFGGRLSRPELLGLKPDEIEAARLAEVLAASERGEASALDPTEDPSLVSLTQTANTLRFSLEAASTHASFHSFHELSRSRVLAATPRPRRVPIVNDRRESLVQRWNGLFTSVSAAAAAAVATFVVTVIAVNGGPSVTPVTTSQVPESTPASAAFAVTPAESTRINLTAMTTAEQVQLWRDTIAQVQALTSEGQPVDEPLLRELADVGASVSQRIKADPNVAGTDAYVAWHAGYDTQKALADATVDESAEPARATARATSSDAMVVAAQYLTPERMPLASDVEKALGTDEPTVEEPVVPEPAVVEGDLPVEAADLSSETDPAFVP